MPDASTPVALVTGASTGIGRATAFLLPRAGYRTYATVRTPEAEASLRAEAAGTPLEILRADFAREADVGEAVRRVRASEGRIDALVNNAGYAQLGAVEDLPRDVVRRQFEVNVFSAVQACREVLPTMRAQRAGRIVNVSSLAGRVSVPFMGAYCASKFALEAFSDALRIEAKPFGVRVAIVEPGPVITRFQRRALESLPEVATGSSAYETIYESYRREFETGAGATPGRVAHVILKALQARRPRSRYRVRAVDAVAAGFTQIIPKGAMDPVLSRYMGLRKLG